MKFNDLLKGPMLKEIESRMISLLVSKNSFTILGYLPQYFHLIYFVILSHMLTLLTFTK